MDILSVSSLDWSLKDFCILMASLLVMTISYGPSLEAKCCPLSALFQKYMYWSCIIFCIILFWHRLILDPAKWLWHFADGSAFPCFGMVSASFQNTRSFLKLWVMTQTSVTEPSDGLWTAKIIKFVAWLFQQLTLMMKQMSLDKLRNCVLILSSLCFWCNDLNLWQFAEMMSRQWWCLDYKVGRIYSLRTTSLNLWSRTDIVASFLTTLHKEGRFQASTWAVCYLVT